MVSVYAHGCYSLSQAPISDIPQGGVAPIVRSVWLPAGQWNRWNGSGYAEGPSIDTTTYSVAEVPLFVRPGALLPLAARGGESSTSPDLVWTLWISGSVPSNGTVLLYEDDGETATYQRPGTGAFTAAAYTYIQAALTLTVSPVNGSYSGMPSTRGHSLQVRAAPGTPVDVRVNGTAVPRVPPGSPGAGWWVSPGTESPLTEPVGALIVSVGSPTAMDMALTVTVKF